MQNDLLQPNLRPYTVITLNVVAVMMSDFVCCIV